jgi:uncharacterized membrane-anchored protein YitT (DUF2179 family)
VSTPPIPPPVHTLIEDILAILIGTLFVSFGIAMFKQAGLLTGSTAGLAFSSITLRRCHSERCFSSSIFHSITSPSAAWAGA